MLYKRLIIGGEVFQIAVNQTGQGEPSKKTVGAVGVLYMDTNTGDFYKCISEKNGVYDWEKFASGSGVGTETDPTVPDWAKHPNKPTYTAQEVGALPASTVIPTVPKNLSEFNNDVGYLTESDKPDIVAMVIEALGGNPVFGYVDEDNNIIVSGNLPDGTYTVKYELEDGSTVDIGELVLDANVYYSVTNHLTNCTNGNGATQAVQGGSYSATISANTGYELSSVTVTMGGTDISSSAVSGGNISIANVTGDIVITAMATEIQTEPTEPTNFAEPNATNKTDWSIWCNDARFGSDGSYRELTGKNNAVTNYIPIEVGDVLYITGMNIPTTGTSMNQGLLFADANKDICSASYLLWYIDDTGNDYIDMTSTDSVPYILDTAKMANHQKGSLIKYVRISGIVTGTPGDVVINVKRNGKWL